MGDGTTIGWTDATWNPIRGCRRTAPAGSKQSGCGDPSGGGCYAERQAARFCGPGQAYEGLVTLTANGPRWSGKVRYVSEHLMDPFRWKRPRRIFTDSMSDLFYEGVEQSVVDNIVAVMMICCLHEKRGGHIFQTLTKRLDRLRAYFTDPDTQERVARAAGQLMDDGDHWFDAIAFRKEGLSHPNMWWGASVENQAAADERILELVATPAAVRFLSIEPLIGPVVIPARALHGATARKIYRDHGGRADIPIPSHLQPPPTIDWVIAGCESGPRARECKVEWLRAVRDQCATAGVAFFLKQAFETDLGKCGDADNPNGDNPCGRRVTAYVVSPDTAAYSCGCTIEGSEDGAAPAIGAGEGSTRKGMNDTLIDLPYLDGVQHGAFPEIAL